jgi:transposase-like protein
MRREVAEDIRAIYNAPDRDTAEAYLKKLVEQYAAIAPKLVDWIEVNVPEGFTVFAFPKVHLRRLQTSDFLERFS